ncbi:helix-turn-helix domain-containing protein [Ferrimicrobium sp.]|uniref:helix-turn-helix domain-containing protein n=1 Tax=Ferrimicrobium sp. TaxID=2926050 RepID=UPI002620C050|nr:helix-turn-helix domain-containing protein [Ferrimicrobium sp.]
MTKSKRVQLAEAIDSAVKGSGLPQSEVARRAEVDTSSLSRWRRGEQGCPAHRIEKLARALGLKPDCEHELLKLALEVESENRKERDALRAPGLRSEMRELKTAIENLERQVREIRDCLGIPSSPDQPEQHSSHRRLQ